MEEAENREQQTEPTTLSERFSGFANGHFSITFVVALFAYFGFFICGAIVKDRLWINVIMIIATILSIGVYFPAGALTAKGGEWTVPKEEDKILAVLQPAVAAWVWVAIVIFAVLTDGLLALCVFFISMLFAAPSSIFVLCFSGFWASSGLYGEGMVELLFLIGLIAGFLPPLLFALGSFWQSARMEKKALLFREGGTGGRVACLESQQGQIVSQDLKESG